MENWPFSSSTTKAKEPITKTVNDDDDDKSDRKPKAVYLGRFIGTSARDIIFKYDLKKRSYISTTSMDAELSLVTANITLASRSKLFYDPFVGTGSFPLACAHFGAQVFGSDIDGRSIRGKGGVDVFSNFVQYGIADLFGDCFVADLTNSPVGGRQWLDGIVCDPPYGVREGLKVLGCRDPNRAREAVFQGGVATYTFVSFLLLSISFCVGLLILFFVFSSNSLLSAWKSESLMIVGG